MGIFVNQRRSFCDFPVPRISDHRDRYARFGACPFNRGMDARFPGGGILGGIYVSRLHAIYSHYRNRILAGRTSNVRALRVRPYRQRG